MQNEERCPDKSESILAYNSTKLGGDVVDEIRCAYNVARITRRWTLVVFIFSNIVGINIYVIYKANKNCTLERPPKITFEGTHGWLFASIDSTMLRLKYVYQKCLECPKKALNQKKFKGPRTSKNKIFSVWLEENQTNTIPVQGMKQHLPKECHVFYLRWKSTV